MMTKNYRDMLCECGASPHPEETEGSGTFDNDGVLAFICGHCWMKANGYGCCELSCRSLATTLLFDPSLPYDEAETHACDEHIEALGGDAPGIQRYPISTLGTIDLTANAAAPESCSAS